MINPFTTPIVRSFSTYNEQSRSHIHAEHPHEPSISVTERFWPSTIGVAPRRQLIGSTLAVRASAEPRSTCVERREPFGTGVCVEMTTTSSDRCLDDLLLHSLWRFQDLTCIFNSSGCKSGPDKRNCSCREDGPRRRRTPGKAGRKAGVEGASALEAPASTTGDYRVGRARKRGPP